MMIDPVRLLDGIIRSDFIAFTQRAFSEINRGETFVPGWHHEAIAYPIIRSAFDEQLTRVIINCPPRSLKSIMVSVALPAFMLGRDPTRKIICVSYNQDLANFLSRQTRQIMQSAWYRHLFPSTVIIGRGAEAQFTTTAGGYRMAVGTGGTLTGRGGDVIIVDDPLKADDAYSETARNALLDWATRTLFTRLDDKRRGAIILVQQRQHEDDLPGQLLRAGGWYHLNLPAIADRDEVIPLSPSPHLRVHRRALGDLLDPLREPRSILDGLKREMGTADFLAQYQQAPLPPDGDVIKTGWFREYDELPDGGTQIISIDTASKAGLRNDWSVASRWRVVQNRYYLEYVWRRRVEFPELLHTVRDLARRSCPDTILIEDKGTGTGLIQTLRDDPEGFPVVAYDPGAVDKESRMRIQSSKIEGGQVFLPSSAPWLEEFLNEVRRFPNGAHDDQIDSMSQMLDFASRRAGNLIIIR